MVIFVARIVFFMSLLNILDVDANSPFFWLLTSSYWIIAVWDFDEQKKQTDMSCAEHIMENALVAIKNDESFDEWIEHEPNKDYVKSDPKEIWEMANYVFYSGSWREGE